MIVRTLNDLIDTPRDVRGPVWASRRFLLDEDGVGFYQTQTKKAAGTQHLLWYKHHHEAK
jgi:L-ectoine synthase